MKRSCAKKAVGKLDMNKQVYDRKQQGKIIAHAEGSISRIDDRNYVVNSQSGSGSYKVQLSEFRYYVLMPRFYIQGCQM
jgi:hypothetical protein